MRILFAVILIALPLHHLFLWKYGELYPALTMPVFAGTQFRDDGRVAWVTVRARVHFADGSTGRLSHRWLLRNMHPGMRLRTMRRWFAPREDDPAPRSPTWPERLRHEILAAAGMDDPRSRTADPPPEMKLWLAENVRVLYGDRSPRAVEFVWFEVSCTPNLDCSEPRYQPVGSRVVELE